MIKRPSIKLKEKTLTFVEPILDLSEHAIIPSPLKHNSDQKNKNNRYLDSKK